MNSPASLRFLLALVLGLFSASLVFAATDTFDLAKAGYPLDTCVVSGDPLDGGDMGPPVDYIYKEKGKPDRLVRFCCPMCVAKFKKDPAKYLKIIDAAVAAKAADQHPAGK